MGKVEEPLSVEIVDLIDAMDKIPLIAKAKWTQKAPFLARSTFKWVGQK